MMDQKEYQIELINRAQRGDRQCLGQLAQQARERLYTYVYRLTQQDDLAQEIVQESLLEMCKVIGKLKRSDRFWPWLYGIATNKLRRYYRTEQAQRRVAVSSMKRKNTIKERQDGLENLVNEELKHIISGAMKKLRTRHKAVLVMRCYDEMPYSDIAESMGCSEFSTRMLFLRAKRALQRELSRNGLGRKSLLTALLLFGKMTAPSEAAAAQLSVTAAATKVGVAAGIAGAVTSKTAIVSLAAAGVLTAGTVVMKSGAFSNSPENPYTSLTSTQNIGQFGDNDNTNSWYYFPDGTKGPMISRAKSSTVGEKSNWQVLQDEKVNYYYSNNRLYKNNYRMWNRNLSVQKLPTDDPKMTDFICQVEGSKNTIGYIAEEGNNLLIIAGQNQNDDKNQPRFTYNPNALEEDYLQPNWPTTAKIIDNRDQMHRRGWTYFRVEGRINGQNIFGTGRIPFVYLYSKEYSPWLKLDVGSLRIVDNYSEAYISRQSSTEIRKYEPGNFFKGLCRPWLGLHTIDTVRRDAAEQRMWFKTIYTPDSQFAEVELTHQNAKIVYKIDMDKDVVNEITFATDQGEAGNLKFSYLESVDGLDQEFLCPGKPRNTTTSTSSSQGILWLAQLMEGSLTK
jgi:RNA polymerase sigma-70 factor (ECF subfamily)